MPPDVMTIVSTGIGVSVIVGVLSGVCYILAHNNTIKRRRNSTLQWYCVVCGSYIRSERRVVICVECEERVCKQRCSKRDIIRKGWICYTCLKHPSWLRSIINKIIANYRKVNSARYISPEEEAMEKIKNRNLDCNEDKETIRDFIEKSVSKVVGSSIDDANISKLYKDWQYEALFDKYHEDLSNAITDLSSTIHISLKNSPLSEVSPSLAHTNLKLLIERILHEAGRLPQLRKEVIHQTAPDVDHQTYEELLATAILNKIINEKQNELVSSSAAIVSEENTSKFYGKWKQDWKYTELESTSTSSLDEYLQSDSSLSSTKYVDYSSLTIQQRIDEVPSLQDDDDDPECLEPSSLPRNEQSNWYLQKRNFRSTVSPMPVPMLVPNPVTTAKVLIGDKEIDETSDLSDGTSECEVENFITTDQDFAIQSNIVVARNPLGRNLNNDLSDEETSFDSGVRDDRDDFSDKEKFYFVSKTEINVDDEDTENISLSSSHYSNVEKDSEYLEKYGSLPKTLFKCASHPFDLSSSFSQSSGDQIVHRNFQNPLKQKCSNYNESLNFEGSYSRKEKEKWSHPVQMTYNPYSEENIKRRISTNQKYGRDYYTKQASLPSGRRKSNEFEFDFWKNGEGNLYRAVPAATVDNYNNCNTNGVSELIENTENREIFKNTGDFELNWVNSYNIDNPNTHQIIENENKLADCLNEQDVTSHDLDIQKQGINEVVNKEQPLVPEITSANVDHSFTYPKPSGRRLVNRTLSHLYVGDTQQNSDVKAATNVRRLDNTLIKKIYSNPVVRSFALSKREQIPYETFHHDEKFNNTKVYEEQPGIDIKENSSENKPNHPPIYSLETVKQQSNSERLNTRNFSLELSDNGSLTEQTLTYNDDFKELKDRRLVASRLGEISRSFPSLTKSGTAKDKPKEYKQIVNDNNNDKNDDIPSADEISEEDRWSFLSVKELKKLFEKNEISRYDKDKPVHSLTARSISQEMKMKLRNQQGHKNDDPL